MGWGGAGGGTGNASAGIGAYYFLGAVLLYAGGIGEWILGNTFPAVVFFTFGGFWGTFGEYEKQTNNERVESLNRRQ